MLNSDKIFELENYLRNEFDENLPHILIRLNANGRLEEFLSILDLENLIESDAKYINNKSGRILVCGASDVDERHLLGIVKKLNLKKDRFEFCLDYHESANYNFDKIQNNSKYSLIIVGPMPHSGPSKKEYSSVITRIETEEGFPPIIRAGENELNISQASLKKALINAMNQNIITPDLA